MEVSEVKTTTTEYKTMSTYLEDKATAFACYDVKISDKDGNNIQPTGKVNISLKLTDELIKAEGDTYVVLYVDNDKYARIDCAVQDDTLTFETDHFSVYTVIKYKNELKDTFSAIPKDEDGQMETLHIHKYTEAITTEATCTEKGIKTFTCSCGDSYTEEIAETGHSFGEFVYDKNATYDADGTETRTCEKCGTTETQTKEGTKLVKQEQPTPPAEPVTKPTEVKNYINDIEVIEGVADELGDGKWHHCILSSTYIEGYVIPGSFWNKILIYDAPGGNLIETVTDPDAKYKMTFNRWTISTNDLILDHDFIEIIYNDGLAYVDLCYSAAIK